MELGFCEELSNFVPSNGEVVFASWEGIIKGQIYGKQYIDGKKTIVLFNKAQFLLKLNISHV